MCYAEKLVTERMGRAGTWGPTGTRQRTSEANWRKPVRWDALAAQGRLPDGSENPDGHRPRIFCASLADVFEPRPELVPWRLDLFRLIEATPNLDWLLLTKRPEEARDFLARWSVRWNVAGLGPSDEPLRDLLPSLWLGVSIEDSRYTWRADVLRDVPAAVRFISAEPLVGSLFEDRVATPRDTRQGQSDGDDALEGDALTRGRAPLDLSGIDWVIAGGESGGPRSRPAHPVWLRELRDACAADGIAYFAKQWGSWSPAGIGDVLNTRLSVGLLPDGRQVAPGEAAETPGGEVMVYRGPAPTAGGKHLDGRMFCEFPDPAVPATATTLF